MATTSFIPFLTSDNNYTLRLALGGVTYQLFVHWNSRDSAWYMDIYAADQTPIAMGIKIVLGPRLGQSLQYVPFFQQNILQVVDTSGANVDAGFDDLGDRIQVIHMTADDFKGA